MARNLVRAVGADAREVEPFKRAERGDPVGEIEQQEPGDVGGPRAKRIVVEPTALQIVDVAAQGGLAGRVCGLRGDPRR